MVSQTGHQLLEDRGRLLSGGVSLYSGFTDPDDMGLAYHIWDQREWVSAGLIPRTYLGKLKRFSRKRLHPKARAMMCNEG